MLQRYIHEIEGNLIGEGTFGSVFETSNQSGENKFALKKFTARSFSSFVHESEMALKTKDCRHTTQVKKSFISNENGYLLMEYCVSDLFSCVKERKFSETEALGVFQSICEAVAELHSKNIAHLDLKLENILLTQEGAWKLCDFGSACEFKSGERKIMTGKIGTPGYCAPEIMAKRPCFPEQADLWSLGIILHALLLNCLPFRDASNYSESFSLNCVYFSEISAATKRLVFALLSLAPEARPTAAEVADILNVTLKSSSPGKGKESAKFAKIKTFLKSKASYVLDY